jgi:hypothetical protein
MEVTRNRPEPYYFSSEPSLHLNETDFEVQPPTNSQKKTWLSLGISILQGFCKPRRNAFASDEDSDEDDDDTGLASITTLVTRQHSPNYLNYYFYGSTQSILEIWVAACVLLGWTIRFLQYKDSSLALTTAVVGNKL